MRVRASALLTVAAMGSLAGLAAGGALDDKEEAWLDGVRPIMLAEEEDAFRKLRHDADREEFREIFWARRDPDLATAENEFRTDYEEARHKVDREFQNRGQRGSATGCGRVYLLLGPPDEVRQEFAGVTQSAIPLPQRQPKASARWIYRGDAFEGGQTSITFDEECRSPGVADRVLSRIAASKVTQPRIGYRMDAQGRLVTLEDQLTKTCLALLASPSDGFPIDIDTSFLRADQEGVTGVVGLVHARIPGFVDGTRNDERLGGVRICTRATGPDGREVAATEQVVKPDAQPDGSFLASYQIALVPRQVCAASRHRDRR